MLRKAIDSFIGALGMFTRLPVPYHPLLEDSLSLLLCYPLVGAVAGGLWYGLWLLCFRLGLSILIGGALLCLFPLLITGFMHMDGFMDVMDALLSGRSREKRLVILKDPNTGAFSVCAFGCLLLLQFVACADLYGRGWYGPGLICLPIFSRSVSALCLTCPPMLEGSTLGRAFGSRAGTGAKAWFALWALLSAAGLVWTTGIIWVPITAGAASLLGLLWAMQGLGGSSGDVAGFCLVLAEVAGLIAMSL